MNDKNEPRRRVIFAHQGGPSALVAQVAEELRKAFPTCDVTEIENPPPCAVCERPALVQIDGRDLCPSCGDIRVELAVEVRGEKSFTPRFDIPPAIVGEVEEPKYANRATRRHAEPGTRYLPATQNTIRGHAAPASRNQSCPCGSGRKFKNCCALEPVALDMLSDTLAVCS